MFYVCEKCGEVRGEYEPHECKFVNTHGRWFHPYRLTTIPEINPLLERPKKGTYVIVYKAEMRFQYEEAAVPPDEQGEVLQIREVVWKERRGEANKFIEDKTRAVHKQHKGKINDAKIYKVNVKITPMKEVLLKILNHEGIDGIAYICWELNGGARQSIVIGGE